MNLALAGDILAAGQDARCQLVRFQVHQQKGSKADKSGEERGSLVLLSVEVWRSRCKPVGVHTWKSQCLRVETGGHLKLVWGR